MSSAALEIEPGSKVVDGTCDHCGQPMTRVTSFVTQHGDAHAVCFASCYHHEDGHEVWLDVVFSPTWGEDPSDRVSFGCRVGPVEGQPEPAASLVAAAAAWPDSEMFGTRLSRDDALAHPLLRGFWQVVDHVLVHEPVVRDHLYGPDATFAEE